MEMHEARLYQILPASRVRCGICQWHCVINPDRFGVCRMYQNRQGALQNLNYALASSISARMFSRGTSA